MTTYTAFVAALAGLSITGVERQYTYEPDNIDTADMPASFVRLPSGGTNEETMTTCNGDGKIRTADLVVVMQPFGQDTSALNYAATVTMADNVETALDASTNADLQMARGLMRYEIVTSTTAVPGFWAVVATVTGRE